MKVVKILLALVLTIIAIVLIAALFIKKDIHVEREVVINKPKEQVFDYIKLLKNQDSYSKWGEMEPTMHKEYSGTDGTVGFISRWKGDKVGQGEQTITKIVPGERLETDLHFIKPFESHANAFFTTEAAGPNQTKVKWGFDTKMNYPMNAMQLFMDMNESVGKDFQTGLDNLKVLLEKQ
jgi:uncharacterized protein YndB with AHSA1/START domain